MPARSKVVVQGTWSGGKLAATEVGIELAGGPAKIRPSGCSASAITTAAILASG